MAGVFLGNSDDYRVLTNNTTIYGAAGDINDSVVLESGAQAVTVNGNVDRIDFFGSLSDFTFQAGFGANMNVYLSDGVTLVASIPLQDDADGTQLVFEDGSVNALYSAGTVQVGGVTLTGTADAVNPDSSQINAAVTSQSGVETDTDLSTGVFLESGDAYREINDGVSIYGVANDSTDSVIVESGATDISVNANIDRIDFRGDISDFTFRAGFGANMEVYASDGTTLLISIPIQDDADGSRLVFENGAVDAVYNAGMVSVGGVSLTGTPATIQPDASQIDDSITTGSNASTINVSPVNDGETYIAESGITETFVVDTSGSYEYSISNFELGTDVIETPEGTTIDNAEMDGQARLEWASEGVVVGITLLGLTNQEDLQLTTSEGWGSSWVMEGQTQPGTEMSLDVGDILQPETIDASSENFAFTDDANIQGNVIINGFSNGDTITFFNASSGDYSFNNDGEDVDIIYNNGSLILNIIRLTGVADASDLIYDEASFEAVLGFDAVSYS